MSICRNCYSCAYFPCGYSQYFNIKKEYGCIYWSGEIVNNFVSNNINQYSIKPKITSDTKCEHANISEGTHLIDSQDKNRR